MSRKYPIDYLWFLLFFLMVAAVFSVWAPDSHAYQRYNDGCQICHGTFTDGTSPKSTTFPSNDKHEMHRASTSMDTDCGLCHTTGDNRNPFLKSSDGSGEVTGLGCTGCHNGPGLRAHHRVTAASTCGSTSCHPSDPAPPSEDTAPPYYGTVATNANNPCNPLAEADVNENWSIGDFEGLDNDGDNLYDSNDTDCQAATAPTINLSPASLDFGAVTVGNSPTLTTAIQNTGNADLNVSAIARASGTSTEFTFSPSAPFTVPPDGGTTLSVTYTPTDAGPDTGSLVITSDASTSPTTLSLSGTGTVALVPDITVTDSVEPFNNLQVPFGNVLEGTSSEQTVTVRNDGPADLLLGTVAPPAAPFSILTDTCSIQTLAQGENCTITVQFAPIALGTAADTFDIPSNDPDENPVSVTVSGTGVANNPPEAPGLVLPFDGATGIDPASVTFEWNRSTDPDGDTVTYDLFVCPDDDTFASCPDPLNPTPVTAAVEMKQGLAVAASGVGMTFFGIAFVPGIGRRRKAALLLVLALAAGMLLFACGNDETAVPRGQVGFTATNLASGTTYFWKVVATDGMDSTGSATRSFTTR